MIVDTVEVYAAEAIPFVGLRFGCFERHRFVFRVILLNARKKPQIKCSTKSYPYI